MLWVVILLVVLGLLAMWQSIRVQRQIKKLDAETDRLNQERDRILGEIERKQAALDDFGRRKAQARQNLQDKGLWDGLPEEAKAKLR